MTQEQLKKSVWSWKTFSEDFLQIEKDSKKSQSGVAVSVFAAFFIVVIAAQLLGFANQVYNDHVWQEKYKNSSVVVYSTIG